MSVPPPMLAVPPPSIQSVEQIGTVTTPIVQSTNLVSQASTMVTATPVQTIAPQNQPQIIQQTILTPSGNMVIQQQPVQQSVMGNVTNLNVPPPTNLIPMKPPPVQLSQPPPSIQLQPSQPTQIVLANQPQTNYQYIHQQAPVADASQQPNSVTIQHIYQPQGIVQQTQPIGTFTTQQTTVHNRPPSQQYILQGNTA